MHSVKVYRSDSLERALKRLKAKLEEDNVIETVHAKRYFETESEKRKRKQRSNDRKRNRRR